ncbi:MAG TPA: glycosyltransferase family 39 protein [Candidatus Chromulinivoraceae bacterium]|nr:glycosyltransferase family 39 protein [Candidatus Chromulinivoraceae bacterium]
MIQTMVDRFRSRKLERHFVAVLLTIVVGAMLISLIVGLQQSVWFDEAYSIMLAKQPVINLIHLTAMDTHPPFYYLLLKGWASVFGWGELALRSLSVLAMGGAVLFGGLLIKRLFGVRAALMALPFAALSPLLLRYGFEIRMYAVASFIGIAATYVLVSAIEVRSKNHQWKLYALYALLVAIGVYTLYYTVLLWLAHFTWLAWKAYKEKKPIIKTPWFVAFVGSVLLFLPWVPEFIQQITNGALAAISQPMTIDNLSGIVSFAFIYRPTWQLDGFTSIVMLFVLMTCGIFAVRAFRLATKRERVYLWLLVLYTLVPIVLIALVSLLKPMYVERYISHVIIGVLLFIGVTVTYVTRKASPRTLLAVGALYIVLLLGVGHLADVGNYNYQRLQKPAIKQAVATIDCSQDATVLAADPYVAIELSYYMPNCEVRFYSQDAVLKGGYTPLSDSPLKIEHPSKELANSHKLVYVYYDKAELTMPTNLLQTNHESYGPLNVDTFSAE